MRRTVEIIDELPGAGPRVLLLPGLGNRGAGFRRLARALQPAASPVIVEYPEGRFAGEGAKALAESVRCAVGPVDAVIASSFGGMVAGHLVASGDVRGAAFLGSFTMLRHLGVRASLLRLMGPVALLGQPRTVLASVAAFGRVGAEHVADIIPSTAPERAAVWHRAMAIPGESHGVCLREAKLNCVALQGTHDLLVPASTLSRLAASLPPGSRTHLLKGAGHVPYITHVDECVRLLVPWLHEIACGVAEQPAA